jgi:hypothetical protein
MTDPTSRRRFLGMSATALMLAAGVADGEPGALGA